MITAHDQELYITIFGAFRLENQHGTVEENPVYPSLPLLILKYLVLNPGREVDTPEIITALWPDKDGTEQGLRTALCRLRKMLEPLQLSGNRGLILSYAGYFKCNPKFTLHTDADEFLALVDRLEETALEDPEGLNICKQALTLYRGPLLGQTRSEAPWVENARQSYARILSAVAESALRRMLQLGIDEELLPLLCQRAVGVLPENEALHRSIISYLVEQKKEVELTRHILGLTRAGKKTTAWLDKIEL